MLITFTTEHGNLVIRAEDLRRLEDSAAGCFVCWVEHNDLFQRAVDGTAAENQARIVAQETAVIAAYEEAQRRAQLPDLQIKARTAAKRGGR